ncbi:hypothetical protein YH65_04560 [Sulfurovum lithotrophicum]|uniref:Uncharacterized protein n=1 Tax=Sulfurovum lithotrophicum TaxID=206403 RepID=A0A7U4M0S0_9BACT|nr:hypothetical protein [Sulfurovum lithotrophicum]AKF24738.1 hypothetical protein YH65_04560 [Sulfurovum lithotrophicum]
MIQKILWRYTVNIHRSLLLFVFILAISEMLIGSENNPIEEPDAFIVKVEKNPAISRGKIALLQGTASPEGTLFKVPSLSIDQKVMVLLLSNDPAVPVNMELRKYHWTAPRRKGSTNKKGEYVEYLRTQGDLFIKVFTLKGEQPYRLVIWVDKHTPPPMSPVLIPRDSKHPIKTQNLRSVK